MRRLPNVLAAFTLLSGGLLGAGPAFAHAMLRKAVPAVGSTVQAAPSELSLTFSEAVEPRFSRVTVRDPAGVEVQTGGLRAAAGDAQALLVGLKPLRAGRYTVEWHATSVDTHRTEGKYSFTVAR